MTITIQRCFLSVCSKCVNYFIFLKQYCIFFGHKFIELPVYHGNELVLNKILFY